MGINWPNGAPFALCLTHDVDRISKQFYHHVYFGLRDLKGELVSFIKKAQGNEPYQNFQRIMELEDRYNARSTFLFMHETHRELTPNFMGRYLLTDRKVPKIISALESNGWEIGIHGSYYSFSNPDLYRSELQTLQSITQKEIVSVRQHHLNLSDQTSRIQKSLGLKYDSSVGYSGKLGDDLPSTPYFENSGILEMPISLMDKALIAVDLKEVYGFLNRVANEGGVFMLDFHQCYLNESENPLYIKVYRELIQEAKLLGAWIAPMREIGEHVETNQGK